MTCLHTIRITAITLGLLITLSGCDDTSTPIAPDGTATPTAPQANTSIVKTQPFFAMGTMVQVTTYDVPEIEHQQAAREIEQTFLALSRQWQPWQKTGQRNGALATINQDLLAGRSAASSQQMNRIMLEAAELSASSRGLFNPALGQLVQLWGFDRDSDLPKQPPSAADIQTILQQQPGMHQLRYSANSVNSTQPLVLDFGAFLKGYAVDRAIDILRDRGITSALVNAGGDLRGIGDKNGQPWRIGIRDPRRTDYLASIALRPGEAIFSSGDYERYFDTVVDDLSRPIQNANNETTFQRRAQRYHHILDPRTGYPATRTSSVTVITRQGAQADAAATALFVAGPGKWETVAIEMGIAYVLMVDENGNVYMNPAMAERVKFNTQPQGKVLLSPPLIVPQ